VELSSGQSFAIAGLLQNNSTQDASKVPFLGDVPVLGALFKSDRYRRNETELVIVVTPYLVNPVSANTIALPTDGLIPPTDGQRILYGSTNRQDMPQGAPIARGKDGNALVGPAGFQLD
jgi:pilus assembly protein CpaC